MACPYFYPTTRSDDGAWAVAPRLPLGDAQQGQCRAGSVAFLPEPARVLETCNTGYARRCCDHFPPDAPADAVRFHILEESVERIRVQFTFEKDCWPAGHGILEYSAAAQEIVGDAPDEILKTQAEAFIGSYLRRRTGAG